MMGFILGLFFGAATGLMVAIIVSSVGERDHREEDYKMGYDHGYHDAIRDARGWYK